MTGVYYVSDYPSEGNHVFANPAVFDSLEEAREEVKRRLGDLEPWRLWGGIPEDDDVEAYHESREDDCGGCSISKE